MKFFSSLGGNVWNRSKDVQTYRGNDEVRPPHVSIEHMAFEITGMDRPGLISEISAVLTELGCLVTAAVAWTHNSRMACIIYVEKECKGGKPITEVQAQLENVVEAHHCDGEKRSMRLTSPAAGRTHTERRLHQLMSTDGDYEGYCCSSPGCYRGGGGGGGGEIYEREGRRQDRRGDRPRGYDVVNVRSIDRLKLLFDTVCTLTDMDYVVFHAAVSSMGSIAIQIYHI
ncbi:hypothetical protein HYC85_005614 [Camellia sinensis]|uniref:ACT domain-containing protein ACR n=1 Tax=Camellia sinensis TaxID=4442 RepID=A0A7J7I0E1_CAMSI|nr:hypothetical protein HYC85_005614 [Camellia sinensis]